MYPPPHRTYDMYPPPYDAPSLYIGTVTDVFTYDAPSLSSYRLANGPMNQHHSVSINVTTPPLINVFHRLANGPMNQHHSVSIVGLFWL